MSKSAMQELIELISKHSDNAPEFISERIKSWAEQLLAKERQQIIEARLSVTGLNHASPTDDNSLQDAENYFTQKYEQ